MSKRKQFIALILILLISVSLVIPVFANYIMYSGDPTRTRTIKDMSMDTPILYKWNLKLGWSVSQPITVDGFIYHIAAVPDENNDFKLPRGSYLLKIPLIEEDTSNLSKEKIMQLMVEKGARYIRLGAYTKTYSHITWSPENQAFYLGWGTGSNGKLIVVGSNFEWSHYVDIKETIISAPHVLKDDLAIFGAMDGKIYAVKGMKTRSEKIQNYIFDSASNAEITGSITGIPGTNQFAVGLNFRSSGKDGKFRLFEVVDNGLDWLGNLKAPTIKPKWDSYLITNTGVATGSAYDNGVFYFSDKYGTFYAVRSSDGKQLWKTKYSSVPVTLINNSPAVGSENIYFPIRKPGGIVAIKKGTGELYWYAKQGKDKHGNLVDANVETGRNVENNTTIWKTKSGKAFMLYGDDRGQLTFLDFAGNRSEIARTADGKIKSSITLARDSSVPEANRSDWAIQGNGLATEIVIDSKHLIFGVNSGETGELWAYSVKSSEDVSLEFDRTLPSDPLIPGQDNASVSLIMRHNLDITEPLKTTLKYTFNKVDYWEQDVFIEPSSVYPDGQPIEAKMHSKVPSGPVQFWAKINSNEDTPPDETNKLNNIVDERLNPQTLDLSLKENSWRLDVDTPAKNIAFGVYVTARMEHISGVNDSVKSIVSLKLNGEIVGEKEVILKPGEDQEVGPFWVKSSSTRVFMTAEINPYKDQPTYEPTWENNVIKEKLILRDGLDLYVSKVKPPNVVVPNQIIDVAAVVGNSKFSTEDAEEALVRFYFDKKIIEERRVSLNKNEWKHLNFQYKVPNKKGDHVITVTINEDFIYPEITYKNNSLSAGIHIENTTIVPPATCDVDYPRAEVHQETVCDRDGKNCTTTRYYEGLTAEVINLNKTQIKAGQAIEFQVKTHYSTEWSAYKDVQKVFVEFPGIEGEEPVRIQLEPDKTMGTTSDSTVIWSLPQVWVGKRWGEVYADPNDSAIDPREILLDGGNKFYTQMHAQDGPYPFSINVIAAGKNDLGRCMAKMADIKGGYDTFITEEHYVRSVLPYSKEIAFPYGTEGTYWEGKEELITKWHEWYLRPYRSMTDEDYDDVAAVIQNGKYISGTIIEENDMELWNDLEERYYNMQ